MKLCLLTFNNGTEWTVDELIEVANKWGYAGFEFRIDRDHKHGIELDTGKAFRKEAKEKIQAAYLGVAGISTSCRFESQDKKIRKENIETAKRAVELTSDLEGQHVRVFGNAFEEGADREETMKWVGEALNELIEFSRPYNVNVLLEMHGDFNNWNYALKAVKYSQMPDAGLIYNCSIRDMVGSTIKPTYDRVKHLIKHVHMHSFIKRRNNKQYPYKELLRLLKNDGYDGYLSSEIDERSSDPETVLAYFSALYYEMISTLK